LPDIYKTRLLKLKDKRISKDGIIIIKAQSSRSQEKNKEDALDRLQAIIRSTLSIRKKRIATKPTRGSQSRRLDQKSKRAKDKVLRKKVETP
jgi:ribosome-associated protein